MHRILRPQVSLPALLLLALAAYVLVALAMVCGATGAEREPLEAHPNDFGLAYEDVRFTPRDGELRLDGWLLLGADGGPYLIFVHGIGSQRTGENVLALAARLVQEGGYNVLLFDLRAHGLSEGSRVTAGDSERDDVLGAYDFLLGRGAEPRRVGVLGFSFGAGLAVMAAALEPGIAAVVADSPFADVRDLISQETARKTPFPKAAVPVFLPAASLLAHLLYDIDLGSLKPERDASRLEYSILVVHGEDDTRIPTSHGRRVHAGAPPGSELWILPGVEHVEAFETEPDEYVRRVLDYLAQRFGG